MKDNANFLRTTVTLYKQKYNFSVARLVYHCFKKPIESDEDLAVILTRDGNSLNITPSNLIMASISAKQQRIFELNRKDRSFGNEETRKRAIEKSKQANNKQVTQYSIHGKKIKTYSSVAIAAQKTGISASHISNRARGTEYSVGGFIWRFGRASEIDIKPMLDTIAKRREKNKAIFGKKVTQYTLNGRRVATFPTINDAAKATGINHTEISMVMQKKRFSAGGYYWQEGNGPAVIDLSGYEYGEALRAKNRQRPIRQYSKEGKPLQRFDSIKEAAKAVGVTGSTVSGALKGKHETAGG